MLLSWRRPWALWLATFFCVAAEAPHHHLNPIADLVADAPSNSGTFARLLSPAGDIHGLFPGVLLQDVSCLACFSQDFVSSPALWALLATSFEPLPRRLELPPPPSVPLVLADSPSRAPPAIP